MVGDQGFEPRMSKTPDLQSSAVANAARHPIKLEKLASLAGVEPAFAE